MRNPLIVGEDENGEKIIAPFSSCAVIYDDEYVDALGPATGDTIKTLNSVDGTTVCLYDLKCKTIEELILHLDLNGLFHDNPLDSFQGWAADDESNASPKKRSSRKKCEDLLKTRNKLLWKENKMLKNKLKQMKKLLD